MEIGTKLLRPYATDRVLGCQVVLFRNYFSHKSLKTDFLVVTGNPQTDIFGEAKFENYI